MKPGYVAIMIVRLGSTYASSQVLRWLLFVLIALRMLVLASCTDCTSYSIKERHYVPGGWTFVRRAPSHYQILLQIGLKQGRFDELERHLNEGDSMAQLNRLPDTTKFSS